MFYFKAYIMSFWGPAQVFELLVLYQYYYSLFHFDMSTDFGLQIVQGKYIFQSSCFVLALGISGEHFY